MKKVYEAIRRKRRQSGQETGPSYSNVEERRMWKTTWALRIKSMVKFFLWRCWEGFVASKQQLRKKGVALDTNCKSERLSFLALVLWGIWMNMNAWQLLTERRLESDIVMEAKLHGTGPSISEGTFVLYSIIKDL
ncbi:ribonuclease H-like superfamily protein [Striga asiatica]|uniref:Ribonuclease H-like superfamily protein n=1 Tax=Striga asiatica TaxID=4170 RepID=A0A5A7P0L9_STRAF|nr:ribonuclease H-like superfamily protein [Striga asiatica]